MLNKVSGVYVSELCEKAKKAMWNNIGNDRFNVIERIYRTLLRIYSNEFRHMGCGYIYEGLNHSYDKREDAIYAYVLFCLSFIPNNRSRCFKLIELGVEQLMIGAVDR